MVVCLRHSNSSSPHFVSTQPSRITFHFPRASLKRWIHLRIDINGKRVMLVREGKSAAGRIQPLSPAAYRTMDQSFRHLASNVIISTSLVSTRQLFGVDQEREQRLEEVLYRNVESIHQLSPRLILLESDLRLKTLHPLEAQVFRKDMKLQLQSFFLVSWKAI
jgi:hypothetical protein